VGVEQQQRKAAQDFAELLYGQLNSHRDGLVAYMVKKHGGKATRTYFSPPGTLPSHLCSLSSEWHFWQSVCTFGRHQRKARYALQVPAVWVDIDPAKHLKDKDLKVWQQEAYTRLSTFSPSPSIVVFSGRGWHGYWLFDKPIRLEGPDRNRLVSLVTAINRELAERLAGDAVADLARVMRIPGTINPKNGANCRIIFSDGPIYDLKDLTDALKVKESVEGAEQVRRLNPMSLKDPKPENATTRRGRPKLGVTVRDLRTLSPWARHLVMGGAWRSRKRYLKPGGEGLDRSRADMAAVGEMIRSGWSDERIFAAFKHTRWLIGDRFRDLCANQGPARAVDYLGRTIEKARLGSMKG